jgi:hypothetical protein
MAGEVASTVFSRMAVPVLYYLSQRGHNSKPSFDRMLTTEASSVLHSEITP